MSEQVSLESLAALIEEAKFRDDIGTGQGLLYFNLEFSFAA